MLTDEDAKKPTDAFATREEIVTKVEFADLKQSFSDLQTAVDACAEKSDTYF